MITLLFSLILSVSAQHVRSFSQSCFENVFLATIGGTTAIITEISFPLRDNQMQSHIF